MDILSVTQLNTLVRGNLESSPRLANVCVQGEISGFKRHSSGHIYFNLKDEESALRCVIYRSSAVRLRFEPKDGMSVLAAGKVTVYVQGGYYQLLCATLQPCGIGELELAFRQMYERLEREGLFDVRHKKPLPYLPRTVGIVTSPSGKAVHDIIQTLEKRCPIVKVVVIPVKVQGEGAAADIARGIRLADSRRLADVLIVGRGGGSEVELWPFNEEIVARAIFACRTPVISAVGHEPDHSISDYAADRAAATPTQAAMIAVPDQSELRRQLDSYAQRMSELLSRRIDSGRQKLALLSAEPLLRDPTDYIQERRMQLDLLSERFAGLSRNLVEQKKQTYLRLASGLDALSPLKILKRGYSFVQDSEGRIVSSVGELRVGQQLHLRLSDGAARVTVDELEEEQHE